MMESTIKKTIERLEYIVETRSETDGFVADVAQDALEIIRSYGIVESGNSEN